MKASEIRSAFLNFFASKGHQVVASSPVVPGDDPTLLFTNAGMNQFKDVFLGFDKRAYTRAASSQKCIRAGGKHNDLENVGYTARHHTFFEMLGNFSFGDYFKREAIQYAWELLTEVFKLPKDRLYVTVYAEDDEAFDIWTKEIGLEPSRVIRIGDNKGARYASDNFWMMGDTGPCGPCTEIFYDHGAHIPGGLPGSPDEDGDRYIEIWNNVFMQFNRDEAGVMHKLPKPSVDTGMGLERITAVLQHVHGNYEIDLFVALLAAAKQAVDQAGRGDCDCDKDSPSLKVIADHIRACAFTIADGVIPGNEGRGYVLRRIARRAIRHGYKLGARRPFFYRLVSELTKQMGDAYPELRQAEARVAQVLRQEEERFFETIEIGMELLDAELSVRAQARQWIQSQYGDSSVHQFPGQDTNLMAYWYPAIKRAVRPYYLGELKTEPLIERIQKNVYFLNNYGKAAGIEHFDAVFVSGEPDEASVKLLKVSDLPCTARVVTDDQLAQFKVLGGEVAFKLHDTYGFPVDLTADVCRERGWVLDQAGFDAAMQRQREQARAAGKFKMAAGLEYSGAATTFHGYEHLTHEGATVTAVYVDGTPVAGARAGDDAVIVLDHTPFYAESGGQVGDSGELRNGRSRVLVEDTQKIQADVFGHHGRVVEGEIKVGDRLDARVDGVRRARTMRNHSVTHLMHKALREVLGTHVQQKGSLVDAHHTRFDFAHNAPMSEAQVREVEAKVNAEVLANAATQARVLPLDEAQKLGAMMLFGEKYGDEVRVLDIGSSRELCGGTHVQRSGDIGLFKIVSESGVAAGIRRVEAITGDNALAYLQSLEGTIKGLAGTLKAAPAEVPGRVGAVLDQVRALEKELAALKGRLASSQGDELLSKAIDIQGKAGTPMRVLAAMLDGADAKALRDTMDQLKNKLKSAAIVLAAVEGGKVQLAAGVTADRIGQVKAGDLVNFVAQQVGGKGGGKPDLAMAGGSDASKLPAALASVAGWVGQRI